MSENNSHNGSAPALPAQPRGRVTVDGLSARPFDHADALGAVVACFSADGRMHMHCSIQGPMLIEALETLKERYYLGPLRANLANADARAKATGIVTAREVP